MFHTRHLLLSVCAVVLFGAAIAPAQAANRWAPVGRPPLSDARAAELVTRLPETRPENAAANNYVPTAAELQAFRSSKNIYGQTPAQWNPWFQYVTGRPGITNPSTDDLVQWAARKWGVPAPWMRAVIVVESSWRQSHMGDRKTLSLDWYGQYPFQAQILGTFDVFQSMGVMQIKWTPDGTASPGTEALRWKSTAFNLDYYGAKIRYYYDGLCDWCTGSYGPGQQWASIGAWYQPTPWVTASQTYVDHVKAVLSARTWRSY